MQSFETTVRQALARVRARRAPSRATTSRATSSRATSSRATAPRSTPGWHRALLLNESPYRCEPTTWGLEVPSSTGEPALSTWSIQEG